MRFREKNISKKIYTMKTLNFLVIISSGRDNYYNITIQKNIFFLQIIVFLQLHTYYIKTMEIK